MTKLSLNFEQKYFVDSKSRSNSWKFEFEFSSLDLQSFTPYHSPVLLEFGYWTIFANQLSSVVSSQPSNLVKFPIKKGGIEKIESRRIENFQDSC